MFSRQVLVLAAVVLVASNVNDVDGGRFRRKATPAAQLGGIVTYEDYLSSSAPRASPLIASASAGGTGSPTIIPGFITLAHKVSSGTVTIKDSRTIHIKNFSYDGAGPDAYFIVGKGEPNAQGRKIPNENGGYEVLEGYENQDIELLLPQDLTWNDIDYLSVYCVSFRHNFGYISIPKGLNVPDYQ